tara:strand:- start:585 stop:1025 length:441 start_codon:yes stop_codon:yes gene_type:complete
MERDDGNGATPTDVGGLVESRETRAEFNGVSTALAPRTAALAEKLTPADLEALVEEAQIRGENLLGEYLIRSGGIQGPADITKVAFVAALSVAKGDLTTGRSGEVRKWMELAHATMVAQQLGGAGTTVNYVSHLQVLAAQVGGSGK